MKKQNSTYINNHIIDQSWITIDATNKVLGRLASEVASTIMGKSKPTYNPAVDTGDYVIVINAKKIKVTGNKLKSKNYYSHSLYPGGLKTTTLKMKLEKSPEEVIRTAVKGMLPKNKLASKVIKKLKVYAGAEHPHEAQIAGAKNTTKVVSNEQ